MKRPALVIIIYVLAAGVLLAQGPPQTSPAATPATPPALSELTSTKLENVYLRLAAIQRQQQDTVADLMKLVAQVEAEHPGWTWDVQAQRLVAKPTPAPAKTEKK